MLRESTIICPQHDNLGRSLQHVEKYAVKALCAQFGGCTSVCAKGHWVDDSGKTVSEPVWQLITAYEPGLSNDAKIDNVARYIGREGQQHAVYVKYASGDVNIIDTSAPVLSEVAQAA